MSLGSGIFLSTLIIVVFMTFRYIGERSNLKKILKNLAIWVSGGICAIALLIWGYDYYQNFPAKQTTYYGISIGMSKPDVGYVMGEATQVGEMSKDPKFKGWYMITNPKEIPGGKNIFNYDHWEYGPSDFEPRIDVNFDQKTQKVIEISCYSRYDKGNCESILGISTGTSEENIVEKLGKPNKEKIYGPNGGLTKTLLYQHLNLKLHLEKKAVYSLMITTSEDI